jgi:hypothetical protein
MVVVIHHLPAAAGRPGEARSYLVPTLRVGMQSSTLCVADNKSDGTLERPVGIPTQSVGTSVFRVGTKVFHLA